MIAQRENECFSPSVLFMARVPFPVIVFQLSRDFSVSDHTLPTRSEPAWQKMTQSPLNSITQPVDIEEENNWHS